ncbi:uncharacterized protein Z519_05320 [Cladophialophora bantiana CBS 173.52]|uniref:3-hydroxyisobutyrate dehydrogenase n=1 Tax=Cladophialophora bantiana (strain ATCC 10958 / CBS 173.52 / CDC B-1940 / NIH 8579) TaxID=1442370 RepID=A0A0D2IB43_CLAB1|nr:uncharacterized protein Z519_05320 [Cladophialophora bantiana CBS 173.52]KIW94004.1 hypothetical protein Z519_05320 [Cladophialophora bantiana CBS 173.52]
MGDNTAQHSFTIPSNPVYGFVGIGVMGYGMAMNLRAKIPQTAGFVLCEINEARREQFLQECKASVQVAHSPREVAKKADIIITMLPRAPHVHEAFTNPETGFISGLSSSLPPRLFLECSSIDVATSTSLAQKVSSTGLALFVDAPVSGGPQGSNAGTLTFMVGTPNERIFDVVKPILGMMGNEEHIYQCGGLGAGLATKQLNNYLGYVGYLGLCEVMNAGMLYGLDPKILSNVINASSGMNWNSLHHNPVKGVNPAASSARDFKGGFTTELAGGVIDDAVALMNSVGAGTVLADPVQKVFVEARKNDKCKGMEARSVWKLFAEDGGNDVRKLQ